MSKRVEVNPFTGEVMETDTEFEVGVDNFFCPPGAGGGRDPSCSGKPGGGAKMSPDKGGGGGGSGRGATDRKPSTAVSVGKKFEMKRTSGGSNRSKSEEVTVTKYEKRIGQPDLVHYKTQDGKTRKLPVGVFKNKVKG